MESTPLVSVVIPCYNQARFLDEAVGSVLGCGYDAVEIIVVNDGSSSEEDNRLLRGFIRPKTRVIHQRNMGLAAARNAGIEAASGKYILPLDADDKTAEGFLPEAVRIAESDPGICVVTGKYRLFGLTESDPQGAPYEGFASELLGNRIVVSSLFRKEGWEKAGGYSPKMKYGMEDWDFWISLLEKTGGRVVQLDRPTMYYRQHETSMFRDLVGDRRRKEEMFGMLVRRHLDSYLAHPETLAEYMLEKYGISEERALRHESRMERKYVKYRRLFKCTAWLGGLLLLALALLLALG